MNDTIGGWDRATVIRYMSSGAKLPAHVMDAISELDLTTLQHEIREARWEREREGAGVPSRLWGASVNGEQTPALDRVRTYLATERLDGCCLVLTGPTGVGKTYAAVAAMRRYPGSPQRFWYFPALCGALLDPARRTAALELAKTIHFAVFDDFGVEYVKEGGLVDTFLDEIIWAREAESRPTIITTNLTTDALKARLSDRLVDRLRGDWGRIFECPGESLRGVDA